ncbi:MAG: PLP-dependent aminotransferase family protein [Pedosphaera sp.]|nr:PLP-dependent aminotransferase family protein [Pedosphaera sp.]
MNWDNYFAERASRMTRSAVRELLKLTAQPGMISFAGGLPSPDLFPTERVKEAIEIVLSKAGKRALQYGETEGVAELRDWIARDFSRPEAPLKRENVVITSGGQQALDLIGRILLNENDQVIVENPTYLALLSAWRLLGAQFLPVPSDANGMCVDEIEPLLQQKPKLIYAVPNFQNPQGTTLGLERRVSLVELLRKYDVGLLEDNPYGELRYEGEPVASLFELDARIGASGDLDSNVIYVGTFSKVLMPGLRVGWAIASEQVIEKIVRAKQAADLQTGTLSQHIISEMIRDQFLERHIRVLRQAYRERRDAMLAALDRYFPNEASWTRPDGGMFLMVTLPAHLSASDVLKQALERKVAFVPGEEFHLNGMGRNTFRLNFSNAPSDLIEQGIQRLGDVLKRIITSAKASGE